MRTTLCTSRFAENTRDIRFFPTTLKRFSTTSDQISTTSRGISTTSGAISTTSGPISTTLASGSNPSASSSQNTYHGGTEARRHGETRSQTRMTRIGLMNANIFLKTMLMDRSRSRLRGKSVVRREELDDSQYRVEPAVGSCRVKRSPVDPPQNTRNRAWSCDGTVRPRATRASLAGTQQKPSMNPEYSVVKEQTYAFAWAKQQHFSTATMKMQEELLPQSPGLSMPATHVGRHGLNHYVPPATGPS